MRKYFSALIMIVVIAGCKGKSELKPELVLTNNNVLLPTIKFSVEEKADYNIKYWSENNPERIQVSTTSTGIDHTIVLANVKSETKYNYVIYNKITKKQSQTFSFQTGPLPFDIITTKKKAIDTTLFDGFILIRKVAPVGSDVILDNEGDVVWYHLYDTAVRRPSSWTKQNTILSIYDSSHIVEYDLFGKALINMKLEDYGIPNMIHHDILYNDNQEIVSLTHDSVKMDLRKLGMGANELVRADGIIVLTKEGQVKWKWNLLEVYNPLDYPKRKINLKHSLGHANSIAIDNDGHYVISFRDFSQLWKINSVDGSVIWKLGEGGDFSLTKENVFLKQHAIYFNEKHELMFFDNGDRSLRPNSRILSFDIDEKLMQAKTVTDITLPLELSADKMCSAEMIKDNLYLVCTSKKSGIVSVVNDRAEVLWRVDLTSPSYRAYYLPNPFEVK